MQRWDRYKTTWALTWALEVLAICRVGGTEQVESFPSLPLEMSSIPEDEHQGFSPALSEHHRAHECEPDAGADASYASCSAVT